MAKRSDITPELCRQLLRYEPETGKLFWLPRTPDMFNHTSQTQERACNVWNARFAGKEAITAKTSNGYFIGHILWKRVCAHRLIWFMMTGEWPNGDIDHIDGNRTNNRWDNLRVVDRTVNGQNAARPKNNTSGVVGVHWFKAACLWTAYINVRGQRLNLGYFRSKDDAIAARRKAEREHGFHPNHGRHAARPLSTQ